MTPLVLGAVVLFVILFLLRGLTTVDPKVLLRFLRYIAAAVCGIFALLLFFRGLVPVAFLLGSVAWGLATGGHVWPHGFPHFPGGSWPSGGGRQNQTTSVRTPWLEMELDHSTGAMRGTVLKGRRAGMSLSALTRDEVLELYLEAAPDAETARLLEAYMDREFGDFDWREQLERKRSSSSSSSRSTRTGMSREEALKVLGLKEGATEEEIRAAHRKLMLQNHPDRGGTDYIAAKINEAKDVLLG